MSLGERAVPHFSLEQAEALARDFYAVNSRAKELPSYCDQNFLLSTAEVPVAVLKISNLHEQAVFLEAQGRVLTHLRQSGLEVPRVMASSKPLATVEGPSGRHFVSMFSFLQGRPLAHVRERPRSFLLRLGVFFGRLSQSLRKLDEAVLHRHFSWNMSDFPQLKVMLQDIEAGPRRDMVERHFNRFSESIEPALPSLRHSVIHNDGNDHNILVQGESFGLIDFGDMVYAPLICELAVLLTYLMLRRDDPVEDGCAILEGYSQVMGLRPEEVRVLPDLIKTRACMSVLMSSHESRRSGERDYVLISQGPAWRLLESFEKWPEGYVLDCFQEILGT